MCFYLGLLDFTHAVGWTRVEPEEWVAPVEPGRGVVVGVDPTELEAGGQSASSS
jgi:hypothetical protein